MALVGVRLEAYYVTGPDLLREMVRPCYHEGLWDVDPPSEDEERLRRENGRLLEGSGGERLEPQRRPMDGGDGAPAGLNTGEGWV